MTGQLVIEERERIELSVAPFETSFSVQLWKPMQISFPFSLQRLMDGAWGRLKNGWGLKDWKMEIHVF
mgnify:CR=1 FL=1